MQAIIPCRRIMILTCLSEFKIIVGTQKLMIILPGQECYRLTQNGKNYEGVTCSNNYSCGFIQLRTANLSTSKARSLLVNAKYFTYSIHVTRFRAQYQSGMFIFCSLHILQHFAMSAASPKQSILELHSSAKTVNYHIFLGLPLLVFPAGDKLGCGFEPWHLIMCPR